jgi:hypothetical protein
VVYSRTVGAKATAPQQQQHHDLRSVVSRRFIIKKEQERVSSINIKNLLLSCGVALE